MEREVALTDISDGKVYGKNDMVKACADYCRGCSACCYGRGDTITLDPLDMHLLKNGLGLDFQQLLQGTITLGVVKGVILPSLSMTEGENSHCIFLNEEGRCGIHGFRPGLCRLFPLARVYQEQGIGYVLLNDECVRENRTKVKVSKWIDMPHLDQYEQYLIQWHNLLKQVQKDVMDAADEEQIKKRNMQLLQFFFLADFPEDSFYQVCTERMEAYSE